MYYEEETLSSIKKMSSKGEFAALFGGLFGGMIGLACILCLIGIYIKRSRDHVKQAKREDRYRRRNEENDLEKNEAVRPIAQPMQMQPPPQMMMVMMAQMPLPPKPSSGLPQVNDTVQMKKNGIPIAQGKIHSFQSSEIANVTVNLILCQNEEILTAEGQIVPWRIDQLAPVIT